MKFTITCEMKDRWVPHFLGMLLKMQTLGSIGASRHVAIYSDGDGDFRPKFEWDASLPDVSKPCISELPGACPPDNGYIFDAG
jgi:hypothetical protein